MDELMLDVIMRSIGATTKHPNYAERARHVVTALTQAGYAVVPVEPTEKMLAATGLGFAAASPYRAMVKAAQETK